MTPGRNRSRDAAVTRPGKMKNQERMAPPRPGRATHAGAAMQSQNRATGPRPAAGPAPPRAGGQGGRSNPRPWPGPPQRGGRGGDVHPGRGWRAPCPGRRCRAVQRDRRAGSAGRVTGPHNASMGAGKGRGAECGPARTLAPGWGARARSGAARSGAEGRGCPRRPWRWTTVSFLASATGSGRSGGSCFAGRLAVDGARSAGSGRGGSRPKRPRRPSTRHPGPGSRPGGWSRSQSSTAGRSETGRKVALRSLTGKHGGAGAGSG